MPPKKPFIKRSEVLFFIALCAVPLALLVGSFFLSSHGHKEAQSEPVPVPSAFDGISIKGKAAYVLDVRSGEVLFEKNADIRLPLASVTKIMTALVASSLAPDSTVVTIYPQAVATEGDSGLYAGERFRLRDLIGFSLTASSNDGMTAIAMNLGAPDKIDATPEEREASFIAEMNKEADTLGMKDTYYEDVTGLDLDTSKAGAYGSAKDMATLFAYVLTHKPELLEATSNRTYTVRSLDGLAHNALNTDEIVGEIPGLLGSKTGSTDLAGGNLVVAFDPDLGDPIIVAVLGSTDAGRFSDVSKLVTDAVKTLSLPVPVALEK